MTNLFPYDPESEPALAPDAPRGLGKAMTGGGDKAKRRANDFYPTPPEATRAMFFAEMPYIARHIEASGSNRMWEPCGRGGAIARVAAEFGLETIATDIVPDPGNHVAQLDLLHAPRLLAPIVITNPPFTSARDMVRHVIGTLKAPYLCLLHKTTFWNSGDNGGGALWQDYPCNRRWDMTWRQDFTDGGNTTMTTTWFVWDQLNPHQEFGLLDRSGPILPRLDLFS
jgi:hypothetical protein